MRLIEDARHWYRLWSVRLAIVAGTIAGALVNNPALLTGLVNYVPLELRPIASLVIGITVFVLPTLVRMIPQSLPQDGGDNGR